MVFCTLILLLFAILCLQSETSASTYSLFGEACSRTQKCDRKAWLDCYDGICGCSEPEEMIYNEVRGICVTKSGERCRHGRGKITDCVDHAECGEDGICICDSKYHENFEGTCEVSKLFGEPCSDEDKCSKFSHLDCVDGTCGCKEGISTYSLRKDQCVGALNKNCIYGKCLDGAECKYGTCVCDIDHYGDTSTNICMIKKGVNERCTKDCECISKDLIKLKCTGEKCDCESGFKYSQVQRSHYTYTVSRSNRRKVNYFSHSVTGPFIEVCAPLVGSSCPQGYCVSQSTCKLSDIYLEILKYSDTVSTDLNALLARQAKCECEGNLEPYIDKTGCGNKWMPGDGHDSWPLGSCSTNEDCVNNLVCYSSKCKCPSSGHQKINPRRNYCLSKVGGPCSKNSDCVSYSFCKIVADTIPIGHCHCSDGYLENKDGECEGGPGIACDYRAHSTVPCDSAAGLVCIDRKCSCEDDIMYRFSTTLRKCVGLVGARCQGNKSCIDNAECFEPYSELGLLGRCKCKNLYEETENFTCEPIGAVELIQL